jgi:4-amino-4-deoxy-L-arabinose transferase-like glycosyltransferase
VTSIGNMYLGPLYYYLILPSMVVSRLSPVGPAVFVALLGVVTVGLVWLIGKEWFGRLAGLTAAFLYAIAPIVIVHSRSSWNPNVMPFFSLLSIYGIWRVWQKHEFYWLPVLGMALSFALQSHYLGLLLFPTIGLFWLLTLVKIWREGTLRRKFLIHSLLFFLIITILTVAPLVWFDLRHNFINFNAFKAFFTVRQGTVNLKIYKGIPMFWKLISMVFTRLTAGKDENWGEKIALGVFAVLILISIFETKKKGWRKFLPENQALLLVLVWLIVALLGLTNYKQHIYDHYFGFFFAVPFLLIGFAIERLWKWSWAGRLLALATLIILVSLAIKNSPLKEPPGNQLSRTEAVSRFILDKSEGKPFNLALIAERNYDEAYAFFLELWKAPLLRIEPLKANETIAEQLFVICEQLPCEPIYSPKAEIAMFGWSKVKDKWEVDGVEVYKLIHNR